MRVRGRVPAGRRGGRGVLRSAARWSEPSRPVHICRAARPVLREPAPSPAVVTGAVRRGENGTVSRQTRGAYGAASQGRHETPLFSTRREASELADGQWRPGNAAL